MHIESGQPVTPGRVEKMSKSKRNTVDPEPILAKYGADAVRWFMLSDSPPERDLEWSEGGIEGASRFVQRVWRLVTTGSRQSGEDDALERKLHRTIAAVGEAIDGLQFNKAVAAALRAYQRDREGDASATRAEAVRTLILLIAPMAPHLAEEAGRCLAAPVGRRRRLARASTRRSWSTIRSRLPFRSTASFATRSPRPAVSTAPPRKRSRSPPTRFSASWPERRRAK